MTEIAATDALELDHLKRALNAPLTEVLFVTLKPGFTAAETVQPLVEKQQTYEGVRGSFWATAARSSIGESIDSGVKLAVVVGWDTLQVSLWTFTRSDVWLTRFFSGTHRHDVRS